ncbi:hypothetical protein CRE_08404 [Caenorhabditis remanei]|uniref:Uncharacterized protein n=1 Tax=Caenorhabditis remanei TaxID=31234 RepID=E3MPJ6_CAERE|nr:hypothetical protein CRE_08404 [Caenorhabditis remanei]
MSSTFDVDCFDDVLSLIFCVDVRKQSFYPKTVYFSLIFNRRRLLRFFGEFLQVSTLSNERNCQKPRCDDSFQDKSSENIMEVSKEPESVSMSDTDGTAKASREGSESNNAQF